MFHPTLRREVVDEHDIPSSPAKAWEERQFIRREGDYWTVIFSGEVCRLKDLVGLRYLAYLLLRPHQRLPAIEIVSMGSVVDASDEIAQERARINVKRSITTVLKRIDAHHPVLARHLRATLRTGRSCTYDPDPRIATIWQSDYERKEPT